MYVLFDRWGKLPLGACKLSPKDGFVPGSSVAVTQQDTRHRSRQQSRGEGSAGSRSLLRSGGSVPLEPGRDSLGRGLWLQVTGSRCGPRLARAQCLPWEPPQPWSRADKGTKGWSRLSCWKQWQLLLTGESRGSAVPGAARPGAGAAAGAGGQVCRVI